MSLSSTTNIQSTNLPFWNNLLNLKHAKSVGIDAIGVEVAQQTK